MHTLRIFTLIISLLGLFISPVAGQWSRVTDLPAVQVDALYTLGDTLLAAQATTLWYSEDGGDTWSRTDLSHLSFTAADAVIASRGMWIVTARQAGVYVSEDEGKSWRTLHDGLCCGMQQGALTVTALTARGDSLFMATDGAGIFVLNLKNPLRWHQYGEALFSQQAQAVSALTTDGHRLVSSGGGVGKVFLNQPGPGRWQTKTLANGAPATVSGIALVADTLLAATSTIVWRSTDFGVSWSPAAVGFVGADARLLVHQGMVYLFFEDNGYHLWRSLDAGKSWDKLEENQVPVLFALGSSGNNLFAARNDGLWRIRAVTSIQPGPETLADVRVVYDPGTGPVARIELEKSLTGRLIVSDLSGRVVSATALTQWGPGAHEVTIGQEGQTTGIYILALHTDSGVVTRKFRW